VRHARDRVAAAFAGNPSWTDYKSTYFLTSPEALYGFHVTPELEPVELQLSQCRARPFLPRDGILYFQYNRASAMSDDPMPEFAGRLLAALDSLRPRAFVLDLRFNTGGNLDLAEELIANLEERTRHIPRFAITGHATFSAGITAVAAWKAAGDLTIVGEPIGDELDTWSEGGNIILPNSGFAAHFANAFHSYSEAPCPADVPCFLDLSAPDLRPNIPIASLWADYAAGIDVAIEAIREWLQRD
jgi:hypothetical protein